MPGRRYKFIDFWCGAAVPKQAPGLAGEASHLGNFTSVARENGFSMVAGESAGIGITGAVRCSSTPSRAGDCRCAQR
jgi:hypothetical protein